MQRQLGAMGRQLVWFSLAVCGVVFGIGVLRGFAALQMVRSAILLAVSAVPEGLPVIATTTLAFGVEKMRRRDVLVRRLDAVETLASARVVCFDKTGTLTVNRMSVVAVALGRCERIMRLGVQGAPLAAGDQAPAPPPVEEAFAGLLRIGILCSETQIEAGPDGRPALSGTATENALVQLALDQGMDAGALRRECPRETIRYRTEAYRFMVTTHRSAGTEEVLVAVKGSPEEVLGRCAWRLEGGQRLALTPEDRATVEQANAEMAGEALRVLGFACKRIDEAEADEEAAAVTGLTWLGLAGMADPVRPGSEELMRTLHGAGIHTLIMTGDQVPTARAVAQQLGLNGDDAIEVLDAGEVDAMPSERLAQAAQRVHVLARVSPAQKLAVVRALQGAGVVVGMIGDGINDSPALKAADVGIAMGRDGTDAAREVADVVLQTDDLAALSLAVAHGRTTRVNVRRSVRYLLSSNFSELAVVLAATAAGFGEPLSGPQLLWINLVTDVLPALGLAMEPPATDTMLRPPDAAEEAVLGGRDWAGLAREGGVIAAGGLLACGWGVLRHGASAQARTMTFGGLVTAQLLHALACRPDDARAAGKAGARPPNPALAGALAASAAIQGAAFLVPGVRAFLGVAPIGPLDAAVTLGAGLLPYVVNRTLGTPSPHASARRSRYPKLTVPSARPGPAAPAADRGLGATIGALAGRFTTDRTGGVRPGRHSEGEDAMRRETGIQVHTYCGHRIEVRDDGGDGWAVMVHPRPGDRGAPETLRSGMPNSLAGLLAEARRRVDRRLDAGPGGVRA
jgi:Ca2+-transporting ATPase